jgi:hypothetical protein
MIRMDPPVATAHESMCVLKRAPYQTLVKPQNIERKLIGCNGLLGLSLHDVSKQIYAFILFVSCLMLVAAFLGRFESFPISYGPCSSLLLSVCLGLCCEVSFNFFSVLLIVIEGLKFRKIQV